MKAVPENNTKGGRAKKRVAIIVGQLFQFMAACNMRYKVFAGDDVDIFFIDNRTGLKTVYDNIRNTDCFNNVYYYDAFSLKNKFKKMLRFLFGSNKKIGFDAHAEYSAVLMFRPRLLYCLLTTRLHKTKNAKIFRYDEGLGTYIEEFHIEPEYIAFVETLSVLRGHKKMMDMFDGTYYFAPELLQYETKYNVYKMPPFDFESAELRKIIGQAFPLPEENEFDRKYIFFEDNIPDDSIDDYSLVMKIAEKVGKENLIVKLHPRRPVDRFSEQGIKVSKATGVPWEAFLMQYDFSDKVLITISSAVVLTSNLYQDLRIETFMLFKLFANMNPWITDKNMFFSYIDSFEKLYNDGSFKIPESEEEFFAQLDAAGDAGKQPL